MKFKMAGSECRRSCGSALLRGAESQGALQEMNTKHEGCNCPLCAMPQILSLAIDKAAFADSTPAPIPSWKATARTRNRFDVRAIFESKSKFTKGEIK